MEHTATPWHACGSGILSGGDAIQQMVIAVVHYAEMPAPAMMAEREANKQFIITACNAHDQLVAENAALRSDLNDARSNWEAGAEELRQADLVREQLVAALTEVKRCRDALAFRPDLLADIDAALLAAGVAP
jgi:hypothetical protein